MKDRTAMSRWRDAQLAGVIPSSPHASCVVGCHVSGSRKEERQLAGSSYTLSVSLPAFGVRLNQVPKVGEGSGRSAS